MGQEPLFDLLLVAGVALLASRLRQENRVRAATILFLPGIMLTFVLLQRTLVIGTAGTLGASIAGLAGVFAGLVVATRSYVRVEPEIGTIVVRATVGSLALWPGAVALYILGRRLLAVLGDGAISERLDGIFMIFVAALVIAERGWLYHAYRQVMAVTRPQTL